MVFLLVQEKIPHDELDAAGVRVYIKTYQRYSQVQKNSLQHGIFLYNSQKCLEDSTFFF